MAAEVPAEPAAPEPAAPTPAEPAAQTAGIDEALNEALASAATDTGSDAETAPAAPSGPPMTAGEKDGMRVAVQACWNVGSLSTEAMLTTVTIKVSMSPDGKPDAGSIQMIGYEGGSEAGANQAYEAGRRAIIRCGAKGFPLPSEKYDQWKTIEMVFNPEGMRFK